MRKQNYITMVSSSGNELIKIIFPCPGYPVYMVIYLEVMSTGLGHGIITNTGAMSSSIHYGININNKNISRNTL